MTEITDQLIEKEFSHIANMYFDTAYSGPVPLGAKEKLPAAIEAEMNPAHYGEIPWGPMNESVREDLANLLGVSAERISHNTSTTEVISLVANSFIGCNGSVVTLDGDYPANIMPWMLSEKSGGLKLKKLSEENFIDTEVLKKNIPSDTKVINISHLRFDTGRRFDLLQLGKFCRERDIFFLVDSAQSLGGVEITKPELELIDVLACPTHKWILGPFGHGFGYYSDRALKTLLHSQSHWVASKNSSDISNLLDYTIETKEGAYRFDRGQTSNLIHLTLLQYSLRFLQKLGLAQIEKHNQELADYFFENLDKKRFKLVTPKEMKGGLLSIEVLSGDSNQILKQLQSKGISVSLREGRLRVSMHLFNTKAQVERLLKELDCSSLG